MPSVGPPLDGGRFYDDGSDITSTVAHKGAVDLDKARRAGAAILRVLCRLLAAAVVAKAEDDLSVLPQRLGAEEARVDAAQADVDAAVA